MPLSATAIAQTALAIACFRRYPRTRLPAILLGTFVFCYMLFAVIGYDCLVALYRPSSYDPFADWIELPIQHVVMTGSLVAVACAVNIWLAFSIPVADEGGRDGSPRLTRKVGHRYRKERSSGSLGPYQRLGAAMGLAFAWDESKATVNKRKHGVGFEEASTVFADPLAVTIYDPLHSEDEDRYITLGESQRRRLVVVVFTDRGDRIRIISAGLQPAERGKDYEKGR